MGWQRLCPGVNADTEAEVVEIVLSPAGGPGSLARALWERDAAKGTDKVSTRSAVRIRMCTGNGGSAAVGGKCERRARTEAHVTLGWMVQSRKVCDDVEFCEGNEGDE